MENLKLQINDLSVAYTPEKLAVKHVTTGILDDHGDHGPVGLR